MQSQLSCHMLAWIRARLQLAGISSQPTVFFVLQELIDDAAYGLEEGFAGCCVEFCASVSGFIHPRQESE